MFESGDELNHEEVSELADEYGKDPEAFYEGYRDTWNEYADIWNRQVAYERGEEYKKPSLWVRLCGRG